MHSKHILGQVDPSDEMDPSFNNKFYVPTEECFFIQS